MRWSSGHGVRDTGSLPPPPFLPAAGNVLPFGLSTAPRAYSKLSRLMLKRWRREGIRCSNYIE